MKQKGLLCKGDSLWCARMATQVFLSSSGRTQIPLCEYHANKYARWGEYLFPIWLYRGYAKYHRRNLRRDMLHADDR